MATFTLFLLIFDGCSSTWLRFGFTKREPLFNLGCVYLYLQMDSKPLTVYVSEANEHQGICIKPEMVTEQSLIQSDLKPLSQHHLPALQRQRRYLNPMGPDVCYHCNTFFHTPTDLIHHQLAKHATTFCVLCQKEFSARTKWRRHVNSVHGFGKIVTCPYCDKSGYRQDLIFNHIMNTHNLFPCRECKQTFPSKDELEEHKKSC